MHKRTAHTLINQTVLSQIFDSLSDSPLESIVLDYNKSTFTENRMLEGIIFLNYFFAL